MGGSRSLWLGYMLCLALEVLPPRGGPLPLPRGGPLPPPLPPPPLPPPSLPLPLPQTPLPPLWPTFALIPPVLYRRQTWAFASVFRCTQPLAARQQPIDLQFERPHGASIRVRTDRHINNLKMSNASNLAQTWDLCSHSLYLNHPTLGIPKN